MPRLLRGWGRFIKRIWRAVFGPFAVDDVPEFWEIVRQAADNLAKRRRAKEVAQGETNLERKLEIGSGIVYVDSVGTAHDALVTAVRSGWMQPGCDLVYFVDDESKPQTSIRHKSEQPAPGNFWRWGDEATT